MLKKPIQPPRQPLPRPASFSLFDKPVTQDSLPLPGPPVGGVVSSRVQAQLYGEKLPTPKQGFGEEQRRSTRAQVNIGAEFEVGANGRCPARITDLSNGGVQLITAEPILVGTRTKITFIPADALRSGQTGRTAAITIEGRVMRSSSMRRGKTGFVHGIAFVPAHPHREIIRLTVIQVSLESAADSLNSMDRLERQYVEHR